MNASYLARRLSGVQPSVMGRLLLQAAALRAQGVEVIDMAAGAPDMAPPDGLLEAAATAVMTGKNNYGDAAGILALRMAQAAELQKNYGLTYDGAAEVTVTAGASAALQSILLALCNPGDGVAVFEPFYEGFLPLIKLAGGKARFIPLHAPDWSFDTAQLSRALSGRTRFLLLNTPHNPSGKVFSAEELAIIAGYCRARGIIAVADETYAPYVYGSQIHRSIANEPGMRDLSLVVHSASKVFNVPGWRIGTVAAPLHLTAPVRIVNGMSLGAPIPCQHALADCMTQGRHQQFSREMAGRYAPLMVALCSALRQAGFTAPDPQGTLSVFAGAGAFLQSRQISTCEQLSQLVLEKCGILTVPGSPFYRKPPREPFIRFSFARSSHLIDSAVEKLRLSCA